MRVIKTYYDPKPIPCRQFDWIAITDDYEGGDGYDERAGLVGFGASEQEAIADLNELLDCWK